MSVECHEDQKIWLGIDIGLDVSAACLIDQSGEVLHEAEVLTTADEIGRFLTRTSNGIVQLIGMEASSLSPHLVRGLRTLGYPVAMFDSRQARKFLRISEQDRQERRARTCSHCAAWQKRGV